MIVGALQDVGGQEFLAAQARKNPRAFLALVAKVVPRELAIQIERQYVVSLPSVAISSESWIEEVRPARTTTFEHSLQLAQIETGDTPDSLEERTIDAGVASDNEDSAVACAPAREYPREECTAPRILDLAGPRGRID